jgi:hypothetical protein
MSLHWVCNTLERERARRRAGMKDTNREVLDGIVSFDARAASNRIMKFWIVA